MTKTQHNIEGVETLNRIDARRLKKDPTDYSVFKVFMNKKSQLLQIAFGFQRHRDLKEKFGDPELREDIGGGVIAYSDGEYSLLGREGSPDAENLSQDIIDRVCAKLKEVLKVKTIKVIQPMQKKGNQKK